MEEISAIFIRPFVGDRSNGIDGFIHKRNDRFCFSVLLFTFTDKFGAFLLHIWALSGNLLEMWACNISRRFQIDIALTSQKL